MSGQKEGGIFSRMLSSMASLFSSKEEEEEILEISEPSGVKHIEHVQVDPNSPTGFAVRFMLFLKMFRLYHGLNHFI
jgi:hypothetical protein